MPRFRSLPGIVQLLIAIVVMAVLVVVAEAVGLGRGSATLVGVFGGSLLLCLWEALGGRSRDRRAGAGTRERH